MDKQKVTEIRKEIVKLIAKNPDLPIKVFIEGDCSSGEDGWYAGEILECTVTEITEYKDKYYERDDFVWLEDLLSNEVCDNPEYINLSDEEFDRKIADEVERLGWEKVILLKMSIL